MFFACLHAHVEIWTRDAPALWMLFFVNGWRLSGGGQDCIEGECVVTHAFCLYPQSTVHATHMPGARKQQPIYAGMDLRAWNARKSRSNPTHTATGKWNRHRKTMQASTVQSKQKTKCSGLPGTVAATVAVQCKNEHTDMYCGRASMTTKRALPMQKTRTPSRRGTSN